MQTQNGHKTTPDSNFPHKTRAPYPFPQFRFLSITSPFPPPHRSLRPFSRPFQLPNSPIILFFSLAQFHFIFPEMALTLPTAFAGFCLCKLLTARSSSHPSTSEQHRLASCLADHCSIFDQIRWRRVSKSFKKAIDSRLRKFTRIDVRCYNGLAQMCEEGVRRDSFEFEWHPKAALMVLEMGPAELGIAVDTKMRQEDVKALVQLLSTFRRSVEQLCMDSPIIEVLVSQINRQQMNILLDILKSSRTVVSTPSKSRMSSGDGEMSADLVGVNPQNIPYGPFFPNLKKLTITSQSNQLEHLSRLLSYAVGVDFLYESSNIDLLCLKICIGSGLWSQKPSIRLFRHVTKFRQWTEAGSLGERYFQQFTGGANRAKMANSRI